MEYSLSTQSKPAYRTRALLNLLHMGHCAPAVMQTVLDINHKEQEWLVKFMAGMPGGIGNTGYECGGITSPLVILGLRQGMREQRDGLPLIFDQGHDYYRRFSDENAGSFCKDILGTSRIPLPCIHAVRHSPELLAETLTLDDHDAIRGDQRETYSHLYAYLLRQDFHCAHSVFQQLEDALPTYPAVRDASSAFIGGTLFKGITCGAFTAGVMAIGLKIGEIEASYPRVVRMLAIMVTGGNAFDESLNKFNRAMNAGHRLSKWFRAEFGSTQCRRITQCDFSSPEDVEKYIAGDGITRCRRITRMVAEQIKNLPVN